MKKLSHHLKKYVAKYAVLYMGMIYAGAGLCDSTVDPLAASVKPQITALFGAGSTVAYCIYIAEVVLGAAGYIKTKNLMLLAGVPILVLFTSAMFKYISS